MNFSNNPPCDLCLKYGNHCCKADIPITFTDFKRIKKALPKKEAKSIFLGTGRNFKHDKLFVLGHPKNYMKDITIAPCVFLENNRCSIYDNRPDICRSFGTNKIPCRMQVASEDDLNKTLTLKRKRELDKLSLNLIDKNVSLAEYIKPISDFHKYEDEIKKHFKQIPNIVSKYKRNNNE